VWCSRLSVWCSRFGPVSTAPMLSAVPSNARQALLRYSFRDKLTLVQAVLHSSRVSAWVVSGFVSKVGSVLMMMMIMMTIMLLLLMVVTMMMMLLYCCCCCGRCCYFCCSCSCCRCKRQLLLLESD
jgi:hypothetical protein